MIYFMVKLFWAFVAIGFVTGLYWFWKDASSNKNKKTPK